MATAAARTKKYQVPKSRGAVALAKGQRYTHAQGPFPLDSTVGDPLVEAGLLERPTKVVVDDEAPATK